MLRTATLGSKQDWGVDLPLKRRLAKRERTGTQGYFSPHLSRENKTTDQTEEVASTHRDDWYGSADLPNRIESIMRKNSPSPPSCKSSTMATKSPSFAFLLYNAREGVCIRFRWRPHRESLAYAKSLHWRNLKSENPTSPSVASERSPPLLRRLSALPEVLPACPPVNFSFFFPPVFLPCLFRVKITLKF